MPDYQRYAHGSGRILGGGRSGDPSRAVGSIPGHRAWTGEPVDPDTHYLPGGVPTERPACPAALDRSTIAADGEDAATLSGIPAGSEVRVSVDGIEQPVVVEGDTLTLTCDEPASIEIVIEPPFPARRGIYHVQAGA